MGEILTLSELRRRWTQSLLAAVADLAEPVWGIGFWVAGHMNRGQVPGWQSDGGKVVLVLAPHPDDEVGGCAGTIRLHKMAGDIVRLFVVTDGRLADSLLTPQQLARQRQREATCAAAALDIDILDWAGFEEGSFWANKLVESLTIFLEEEKPDIIYTTSRLDFHPDHHRTAFALARSLESSDNNPVIRIYQVHVPLTTVLTNLAADVTGEEAAVRSALSCYSSQWWHLGRTLRMRRYAARYHGLGKLCEPFWEVTVEKFCRLHGEAADFNRDGKHWSLGDITGMRFFSWRDPLAYMKGHDHRAMLQQIYGDFKE